MQAKVIGKRGLKANYVQQYQLFSGKNVYIYNEPGKDSTILEYDQIDDLKKIQEEERQGNQKANPEDKKFHLVTRVPTNLSKQQKKRQEKLKRQMQQGPKTEISRDVIPSQIFAETIPECFICIDKNQEIINLRSQKQNLRRKYQQKIEQLLTVIKNLQKINDELSLKNKEIQNQKTNLYTQLIQISLENQRNKKELKTVKPLFIENQKSSAYEILEAFQEQRQSQIIKIEQLQKENNELKKQNQEIRTSIKPAPEAPLAFKKNRASFTEEEKLEYTTPASCISLYLDDSINRNSGDSTIEIPDQEIDLQIEE